MRIVFVGVFRTIGEKRTDEDRVARALVRAGAEVERIEDLDASLEPCVDSVRPDWVLFAKVRNIHPHDVASLRARHPDLRCAQILFDLMDYHDRMLRGVPWIRRSRLSWWLPFARRMDVVFLREAGNMERYERAGVRGYYLDQAADPEERPAESAPDDMACDLAFFGTCLPARARALRAIGRGHSLKIYSDRPRQWRWHWMRAEPAAYGKRLARAIAGAKIVYGESARNDIAGYWSDRVYRILGHRGFFLTRYVPGLQDFFANHVHLVWGRDDEELVTLAAHYWNDPEARHRIAAQGYEHVMRHHTYDERVRVMLDVMERTRVHA